MIHDIAEKTVSFTEVAVIDEGFAGEIDVGQ